MMASNYDEILRMLYSDIDSRLICCVFQNTAEEAIDILESE